MSQHSQPLYFGQYARFPSFTPASRAILQRKCECGGTLGSTGECEECREKRLQRKLGHSPAGVQNRPGIPPIVYETLRSPGQPLEPATRADLEPHFGHDFSQVRIHTGQQAEKSAKDVKALAYTVGTDVVFGLGQYAPTTAKGRGLLAHELTHVVQQAHSSAAPRLDRQADDSPGMDDAEQEASLAELVIMGQPSPDSDGLAPNLPDFPGASPTPDPLKGGGTGCPVSEAFLMMEAGAAKASCQVPSGLVGPNPRLARFRLVGLPSGSAANLTISEQFTPLEDPYGAIALLKPQSGVTDANGIFDDCFVIASRNPLPLDFRLKVEQNHLLNGAVIGKNQITYTNNQILFCHFDRLPGSCDFGKRCKP